MPSEDQPGTAEGLQEALGTATIYTDSVAGKTMVPLLKQKFRLIE